MPTAEADWWVSACGRQVQTMGDQPPWAARIPRPQRRVPSGRAAALGELVSLRPWSLAWRAAVRGQDGSFS